MSLRKGTPTKDVGKFSESDRLKETLDVLSDPDLIQQLGKSQAFYKKGKTGFTFEEVFGEPLAPLKKSRVV